MEGLILTDNYEITLKLDCIIMEKIIYTVFYVAVAATGILL